ncbi:MAG: galactose ABC transporter substrate-binding protein [Clostridium sp.]|jgi:methyl-galactoside transport system substrate-binding protein|uniref:galactose ABC transporter substrate-binding protein n=1 Tax=Clostridium sp. TaxID=1506 RepID=UPI0025C47B61|nr:galactose ABC transporter substrate-binding protein [Clostridium sp.]MCH3963535.1 galactose ABC transporter substrate-binding protein [Clostridium sp.]MCI1714676.1 galactose ABC transporter substrate-binding protein [Clostridium sp.]MCI1799135.1 galactose ABC transporter substrate-binding protein [Clostridium sp.]MCI1812859.1 galactose ABC transporter substrate-binding protein [Clostridium sp.]MCI1869749.1 galactose ABC transporter substrate-binding protein [Clostridium sp.]
MKLCIKILMIIAYGFLLVSCSSASKEANITKIGIIVGKFDDAWRTKVRNELYKLSENKSNKPELEIWNADNSQKTENEKVDALIKDKVKVLVVNLVETKSAGEIIEKAKKADIPVVFFNVEPSEEDMNKWDKVYYIGARGQQSGTMQGQILADYFKRNPTKDGIIRYVMIKGPAGNLDSVERTKYSVDTLKKNGFKVQQVGEYYADWERDKSQKQMEKLLGSRGISTDCVISNNDDMALGAIDALKNEGYFNNGKYMPVVGVDANSSAVSLEKDGYLLGTVLNDAEGQGKAIFDLAGILANGQNPDKSSFNNKLTDGKYIWVDYKIITARNLIDAK